jgi:RPA family protein
MVEESQKRQIAVKTRIADLINGKYIKEAGWMPNYILTKKGEKISRINLLGVVVTEPIVDISYRNALIDDGSGSISLRAFQENTMFDDLKLGDPIFVIGRPREYNGQVYLFPEIIKKIQNTKWIEVRKFELEQKEKAALSVADIPGTASPAENGPENKLKEEVSKIVKITEESLGDLGKPTSTEMPAGKKSLAEEKSAVDAVNDAIKAASSPAGQDGSEKQEGQDISKKIYGIIKDTDKGEGAGYEEVITKSGSVDAERIISLLLKEGEIFEVSPGKLKVLE